MEKISCPFFGATNITNLKFFIFEMVKKKRGQIYKELYNKNCY
jgi:hypothetical protein